jgi:hypothetical protein
LLDASPAAPELPGLRQLSNREWPIARIADKLAGVFAGALGLCLTPETLTRDERRRGEELVATRFGNPRWIATRHA